MDTETISAFCFVFIDSLVVSSSHKEGGPVISCQKKTLELPYLLIELLYICMPVVQTDGWVDGQLYGQVKVTTNNCRNFTDSYICRYSDFVTNSYGLSLDSSCEKP